MIKFRQKLYNDPGDPQNLRGQQRLQLQQQKLQMSQQNAENRKQIADIKSKTQLTVSQNALVRQRMAQEVKEKQQKNQAIHQMDQDDAREDMIQGAITRTNKVRTSRNTVPSGTRTMPGVSRGGNTK